MKFTGRLVDIGNLEDGKMGFVIRLHEQTREIIVTGLSRYELKALAQRHFSEDVTLTIGSPEPEKPA